MRELLRSTTAYRELKRAAENGRFPHAALVVFPDEVNLRALLKECAKAFFCAEDGGRIARLIDEETFADCAVYPPAGEKLTAELAGRILEESTLRPVEGTRKLFVLDCFHTVTPLVQNKLLKLLEEPSEGVCFLLGATAEHAVLPTVLSRVNAYTVQPFSVEAVRAALVRNHGSEGVDEAAAACGGIYSEAEKLLGGAELFRMAEKYLAGENAALCRELGERKDKRAFLAAVKLLLRDMLFYRTGREKYMSVQTAQLKELAEEYPEGALLEGIRLTDEAEKQIQFNANFAQALLSLAIGIRKEREKWLKLS